MASALSILALSLIVLLAACGGAAAPTPGQQAAKQDAATAITPANALALTPGPAIVERQESAAAVPRIWKYVNSGWVSPADANLVGVFRQELRGFVITSQEELDRFQAEAVIKISRGTSLSLGRVEFPGSVLIAAYYLWRPLQGDPLSVEGFSVEGHRVEVLLELEESAQGKEYPYLLGPMAMVAVDRSHFPHDGPLEFVFYLNGEPLATVTAKID